MAAAVTLGMARTLRRTGVVLLLLALAWAAGFVWFLQITRMPAEQPRRADGIVVLTGGSDRVETALHLLAENRARLLLISGVGAGAPFHDLARLAGVDPGLAPRVTLGRAALSTHGNAMETAAWVRENTVQSLIVVTSGYHMPRALAELSRALPAIDLVPYPVISAARRGPRDIAALRFLAQEYTKFLIAEAGLSSLTARDAEPDHPP